MAKQTVLAPKAPKAPLASKAAPHTVAAPAKPQAPKAPIAPKAPALARKGAPVAPQAATAPKAPGRVANVALTRAAAPVADASTAKELSAAKAKIAQLEAALSKAKLNKNSRTRLDILAGEKDSPEGLALLAKIPGKDWRKPYQGFTAEFKTFLFVNDVLNVEEDETRTMMCAIPRDSDVGNKGAASRNAGLIALHYNTDEDGAYIGEPAYLSEAEFAAVWIFE